jgi:hypothetical protein
MMSTAFSATGKPARTRRSERTVAADRANLAPEHFQPKVLRGCGRSTW